MLVWPGVGWKGRGRERSRYTLEVEVDSISVSKSRSMYESGTQVSEDDDEPDRNTGEHGGRGYATGVYTVDFARRDVLFRSRQCVTMLVTRLVDPWVCLPQVAGLPSLLGLGGGTYTVD